MVSCYAAALNRSSASAKLVLRAQTARGSYLQTAVAAQPQSLSGVRLLSSKGKGKDKKLSKFAEEEADATDIPAEVQFLSQELEGEREEEDEYDDDEFAHDDSVEVEEDDEDDEAADEPALTPAEWAARFEREVAEWDADEEGEEGEDGDSEEIEDDRLYIVCRWWEVADDG